MFSTELQYSVVRYMLNDLGDEAANVGLVAATVAPFRVFHRLLDDPTIKSRGDARVSRDAVDRFSARVKTTISGVEASPANPQGSHLLFEQLRDIGAGLVRLSPPRSVLTDDPDAEFELLFSQWVTPKATSKIRRPYGPRDPLGGLRREAAVAIVRAFREGYGHPLSRKTFSRAYEVRGASSHKNVFDLAVLSGTRRRPSEHLFQHILALPDPEDSYTQAAALCWRWDDVQKHNHVNRLLTAVLYERPDQRARGVNEASSLLREQEIEVIPLDALPAKAKSMESQLSIV